MGVEKDGLDFPPDGMSVNLLEPPACEDSLTSEQLFLVATLGA